MINHFSKHYPQDTKSLAQESFRETLHLQTTVVPNVGERLGLADVVWLEKTRGTEGIEIKAFDHPVLVKLY